MHDLPNYTPKPADELLVQALRRDQINGVIWYRDPRYHESQRQTRRWYLPFKKMLDSEDLSRLKASAQKFTSAKAPEPKEVEQEKQRPLMAAEKIRVSALRKITDVSYKQSKQNKQESK